MKSYINRVSNEQRITILYIPWSPGHYNNPQASLKCLQSAGCRLIFDGVDSAGRLGVVLTLRKEQRKTFGTLSSVSCGDGV